MIFQCDDGRYHQQKALYYFEIVLISAQNNENVWVSVKVFVLILAIRTINKASKISV